MQRKASDRILELEKELTRIDFDKQKDQLELRRNSIVKLQLELDKSYFDLKIQDSIKACEISSLIAEVENNRRLFRAGGGTREAIERAAGGQPACQRHLECGLRDGRSGQRPADQVPDRR